uniref:Tetratricopeptide repeat protein n=1 Tax=uncultured bacterium L413009-K18 TaxID=1343850 RepID=S4WAQ5_9BACT|nr:hypothetical protein [uncultured bacterium L413009-K18]
MRKTILKILAFSIVSLALSQQPYRSVDQVREEWTDFTSYQREEMVSFCDFLFREGQYERCLLTSFQLLYKFPTDPLKPAVLYYIARCYEEMGNYNLAHRYYRQVKNSESKTSITYRAASYRDLYINLMANEIDDLMETTEATDDPYLITFRGYGYMKRLQWEDAKISFISAQELFKHSHYNKLMMPLYQAIENVASVPKHNRYLVFLSGLIMPGGGQFMLKEWDKGQGVLTSVGLLALIATWGNVNTLVGSKQIMESEGSSLPIFENFKQGRNDVSLTGPDKIPSTVKIKSYSLRYIIPPLAISGGIFIGSVWKSFMDTQEKNERLVEFYIQERIDRISPERFLDFPEPSLVSTKE